MAQADLFSAEAERSDLPDGFRYQDGLIDAAEERWLLAMMEQISFEPFQFQGFVGKRQVISFGWKYDFNGGGLKKTEEIPSFLTTAREMAADFAGLHYTHLEQVLITRYPPGATIGWHKDRSVFGDVVGISLLSPCTFRFRQPQGSRWERCSVVAKPRSGYLLRGPARYKWEHSIPAVSTTRFSITLRSLRQ